MASKTHKAPQQVARTSFDIKAVAMTVLEKANAVLPGRRVGGKDGKRQPDSPVLFKVNGRGANGFTLIQGQARKFGATVKLQEVADIYTAEGFSPSWSEDKDGQKYFRVIPVKGATQRSEVNVDKYLDEMFG